MTSYFSDTGHDVRPPHADAAASAGCPLARRAHVTVIGWLYGLQFLIHRTFVLVTLNTSAKAFSASAPPVWILLSYVYNFAEPVSGSALLGL